MPSQTKSILKLKRLFVDLNLQSAVETVRRLTGKGQIRQGYEILSLALGPRRFSPVEYYTEGLWRTDLSADMRASIISEKQSKEINRQLSPIDGDSLHGLLTDKLLTALTLRGAGFPVLAPRAIFGKVLRVPGVESLASETEIASFLRREGTLPIFGKPLHASTSGRNSASSAFASSVKANSLALCRINLREPRSLRGRIFKTFTAQTIGAVVVRSTQVGWGTFDRKSSISWCCRAVTFAITSKHLCCRNKL